MIVLDASAAVELVLNTGIGAIVAERIASGATSLHAPHLLAVEVTQVLRRLTLAGEMDEGRGSQALGDLRALDVVHYDHEFLLDRVWELRDNLSAYDGVYVALAEVLGARLVTCDATLARSPAIRADIELIGAA